MNARRDELITVPQILAKLGGISRRTLNRWRELGHASDAIKLPNGELRVWPVDFWAERASRPLAALIARDIRISREALADIKGGLT